MLNTILDVAAHLVEAKVIKTGIILSTQELAVAATVVLHQAAVQILGKVY